MIQKPERPPRPRSSRPTSSRFPATTLLMSLLAALVMAAALSCVHVIDRPGTQPPLPVTAPTPPGDGPEASPAPAPMATPEPTPTPLPTPTSAPTPTPTPAPTHTPTPAPTPTFMPPATPAPAATATPTPALTVTPGPEATATPTPNPADLPVLVIESPLDRSIIRDESVTIEGITSIGASVSVRGRAVAAGEEGRFRLSVPLAPGINTLDVFAINPDGQRQVRTLTVTYLPVEPCFLTITQPDERDREVSQSTVRLWGRTAADATITVKGIAIPVDQLGIFSTTITLTPGLNSISVVATCTIGDTMQDILRETIEVNYLEAQP